MQAVVSPTIRDHILNYSSAYTLPGICHVKTTQALWDVSSMLESHVIDYGREWYGGITQYRCVICKFSWCKSMCNLEVFMMYTVLSLTFRAVSNKTATLIQRLHTAPSPSPNPSTPPPPARRLQSSLCQSFPCSSDLMGGFVHIWVVS